ncbi:DUF4873 domain-containing protein [Gordonia neofelifaecis]|uniref:DUF4873 domain-containing protein n=1 Tax=Gordonia neofelifaecis NRRL B-59395 TaxID=644548 RepID=F1YES9_9ACTN|nr:DUF4873 domain-containing protein [Gordonia neofelifaecis]EGD56912.1 hypothetical protein SCNU_01000 [Gordonia neofelifaecis NRRL B-59395]
MTTIALVGTSPAIERTRRRLADSPLPFHVVDDSCAADLIVTDDAPPSPNHLGVASAQTPDTFFCSDGSVDYVVAALTEAHLAGVHGVRVRRPVQDRREQPVLGMKSERRRLISRIRRRAARFDPSDYDWISDETIDVDVFDDEVVVTVAGEDLTARLRGRGRVDGYDGRFHWAGTLYSERAADLKRTGQSTASIESVRGEAIPARLAEITAWGTVRITGVGTPPW